MTAQRTKNTAFVEKRHNAENKRDKFIPRIKRGYHMLIVHLYGDRREQAPALQQ